MQDCSTSNDLARIFKRNIGRIVRVFTESGGCSGTKGFTGVLIEADDDFIRLITELPSAPSHPFGCSNFNRGFGFGGGCCNRTNFGTTAIIPIDKIVSFVFNEI